MPRRYYSSTAARTTLSSGINSSVTSITVASTSGFPASFPYTLIIDQDLVTEEIVTVTAASGTTLTVTRGVDGTSGVSHSASAPVNHGVSARDFDEPNAHVNDTSTDVHGQYVLKALLNDAGKGALASTTGSAVSALAAGSNGQMLMADSGATAGLRYVDPPTNRNLLINSAMQVSQRGTSSNADSGSGYLTADRWRIGFIALGAWTQSIETDAPTGTGLRRSFKVTCNTADASPAASDFLNFNQPLEGQDLQRIRKGTSDAQQLTLSFWVKSNVTGTYIAELRDIDNNRQVSASYTISASATWERKTITFPADTTGAFDNDNGRSLDVAFTLAAGTDFTSGTLNTTWASTTNANRAVGQTNLAAATNNYWQVTGVQLETGPVATPFEFEPFEATLRKCQRYYYLHIDGISQPVGMASYYSATQAHTLVHFPTTMRIAPSVTSSSGTNHFRLYANSAGDGFNSLAQNNMSPSAGEMFNLSEISGTAGHAGYVVSENASARLAFSAEL